MFGKIKKIFGIEGLKVDLLVDEPVKLKDKLISGKLVFESLSDDVVTQITFRLVEIYSRGRFKGKKIDRYILKEKSIPLVLNVRGGERTLYDFTLAFNDLKSEIDIIADSNFLYKSAVGLAKVVKGVKSKYLLEAKISVKGTVLHPRIEKEIKMK